MGDILDFAWRGGIFSGVFIPLDGMSVDFPADGSLLPGAEAILLER